MQRAQMFLYTDKYGMLQPLVNLIMFKYVELRSVSMNVTVSLVCDYTSTI